MVAGPLRGRNFRLVDNEVHVEIVSDRAVDAVQEAAQLVGPVPFGHADDHVVRGDVERRIQVGRAASHVVVVRRSGRSWSKPGVPGRSGRVLGSATFRPGVNRDAL